MNKKVAFLFPGQGAQYPGMGKDFYQNFSASREVFQEADDLLGENFSKLIFEADKNELTLTTNSQLAIFITSVAILRYFTEQFPEIKPFAVAGLSLGEYTALHASSRIDFSDCLNLVKARAAFMHETCLKNRGTMYVVLGLNERDVQEAITHLQKSLRIWAANFNCPGQVAISGVKEDIERAIPFLKERGAKRVLPLEVSGAFHCGLMQDAQDRLAPMIQAATLKKSDIALVMNASGKFVSDLSEIRTQMLRQITASVYWEQSIRSMIEKSVDLYIEIGPGKVLTGLNRKIDSTSLTYNIEKVSDLDAFSGAILCNS